MYNLGREKVAKEEEGRRKGGRKEGRGKEEEEQRTVIKNRTSHKG